MAPQQMIFTRLLVSLRARELTVYDGKIPGSDATYPFIYIAGGDTVDTMRKDGHGANIYQDVHVWHNDLNKRGDFSNLIEVVKEECLNIEGDTGFLWRECSVNISEDDTTAQPLLHATITVRFDI